jgi:hypothetical protein
LIAFVRLAYCCYLVGDNIAIFDIVCCDSSD